jgi:NADH dehydrogenase
MKKIIVIGAGFAGFATVEILSSIRGKTVVTLIDKKQSADFLPLLPDCLGRKINPQYLRCDIEQFSKRLGFRFLRDEVREVDLAKRAVTTLTGTLEYDYLVIASGSETNFYGNQNIREYAYTLDSADDAVRILNLLGKERFDNYIVAGGGYTGIEVATNLRLYLDKVKRKASIIIVERTPAILGPLPEWMKDYVNDNLRRLSIEVMVNSTIERIEGSKVFVAAGKVFDNTLVIWAAGVKTAGFIQNLKVEKNPQGRIKVDDYLKLNESCFAIGDAAYFSYKNNFLRMAVQFAIFQGRSVAANIINSIKGRQLKKYTPIDFGYIIPMANNNSCGTVFGLNLKGLLPTALHFIMCTYRSRGFKNKFGVIKGLIS